MDKKTDDTASPRGECLTCGKEYRGWALRDGSPKDKKCQKCNTKLKITLPPSNN